MSCIDHLPCAFATPRPLPGKLVLAGGIKSAISPWSRPGNALILAIEERLKMSRPRLIVDGTGRRAAFPWRYQLLHG